MTHHDSTAEPPSRRRFLRGVAALGLGGAVGGSVLAACGDDDDSDAAGGGNGGGNGGGDIPSARIGYVTPRTGPLAAFGEADAFVLAAMRDELGDAVEIVDRDSESDSGRAGEVAQELISEGVELVLVSSTPDTTVPVAQACDLGEVPCISTVAPWQPHYLGLGGELGPDVEPAQASAYNWHFFWGLEDVIENFIALWEQSGVDKVVGGLWPNDPDGNAWSDAAVGFPPALEAAGFTVVDPGRFPVDTQDFSAQIDTFRSEGVTIVSGVVPPPTFSNFQSQALQQGFNPPVVTVGKALLFPSEVQSFPQGEGLSTEIWWTGRHPFTSSLTGQSASDLAAAFEEDTGNQSTQPLGFAHALFEVAIDALKRAGSADPDELNEALAATDLATVVGPVDFAGGPVPNIAKTPLVAGQWVAGETYPLELAINVNDQLPDLPVDGEIQPIG
ncbi:MAG TPA: ABC transporter substrate-binding protein [Acidimicrobiales bacterium]|nr:ABC transporter substrate-binding protein [Acidimicrobiales bacterium]